MNSILSAKDGQFICTPHAKDNIRILNKHKTDQKLTDLFLINKSINHNDYLHNIYHLYNRHIKIILMSTKVKVR